MGDKLQVRGFDFVDWCNMCRCGETMDHLLLHCGKVYRLWSFVIRTFGISWFLSCSVVDFLFGWWNWLEKHSSNIWNLVPLCLMRCIWSERNWRIFEDLDSMTSYLCSLLVPFLIGLELGDSHLVILSLCPLALSFFVISSFFVFASLFLYFLISSALLCI